MKRIVAIIILLTASFRVFSQAVTPILNGQLQGALNYNDNAGTNVAAIVFHDGSVLSTASPGGAAGGDLTGTFPNPTLISTGTAGTYAQSTFDSNGRETSGVATLPINAGGSGQVTAAAALTAFGGASLTANQTISGNNIFSGADSITGTLNANSAISNLDKNVQNIADRGYNFNNVMVALTNGSSGQGGTIYIGTNENSTLIVSPVHFAGFPNSPTAFGSGVTGGSTLKIKGNNSQLSEILADLGGGHTNLFDSWTQGANGQSIDFENVGIVQNEGADYGYVQGQSGGGNLVWRNDAWGNFAQASFVVSGYNSFLDTQTVWNSAGKPGNIGAVLAPFSDGSYLNILGIGQTWAVVEANSKADKLVVAGQGSPQFAAVLGGGGPYDIQPTIEAVSNSMVSFGYPSTWPNSAVYSSGQYAGKQSGNSAGIGPTLIHDAYANGTATNSILAVYATASIQGATLAQILVSGGWNGIASHTAAGDSAKYSFQDVYLGGSNAMINSSINLIPDPNGDNVNINKSERDYNGSTGTLTFNRSTNGNIYASGNLTLGATTNTASFTLVNTNFISGAIYTNNTGRVLQVSANATLTTAGVSGNAALDLRISNTVTNHVGLSTIVTSIASNYTNGISGFVPAGQTFTFTNVSSGAGDSAGVNGGQYIVF